LVTDAATKEAPVTTKITTTEGAGVGTGLPTDATISHAYANVQVDSAAATTGLYVRLELPSGEDYDLYLLNSDGTEAARSSGFNPVAQTLPVPGDEHGLDGQGYGGHSEAGAENIDGIITPDCGGYTVDVGTATGKGGDLTLKYWLGEGTYVPGSGEAG
jgi:hypothetical protein